MKQTIGVSERILIGLVILIAAGCATIQKDWEYAKLQNSIEHYEEFLKKHPKGKLAEQAHARIQAILKDWELAQSADTIEAYSEFGRKYGGQLSSEAFARIAAIVRKDWELAQSEDSIEAYEEFLRKHPLAANQAKARIQLIREEWEVTQSEDTISAYEEFLRKHPKGELADQARSRLEAIRRALPDWEKALKTDTIKGYTDFLKKHPDGPFSEKANAKIVDLRVADIKKGKTGELPPPQVSGQAPVGTAEVVLENGSPEDIEILLSGPGSQSRDVDRCPTCKVYGQFDSSIALGVNPCAGEVPQAQVSLKPGRYEVVVRAREDASIAPWSGSWELESGNKYFNCFYLVRSIVFR